VPDRPVGKQDASPSASGPFDQIRCLDSRLLLADGYRAAVRADEVARASSDPSNPSEKEK